MKRLGTLVMAILLITGCNAMQPNMEETKLLWAETEQNIQKWAISTNAEASPAEKPRRTPEPTVDMPQKTPELAEEPVPQPPAATPSPEQDITVQESTDRNEQPMPPQTEQPAETPVMIDWPYPRITCPPKPEWPQITCPPEPPASTPDWPYITAPEPPTCTPQPEPMEPPHDEPVPTPQPVPVDPAPESTEQPSSGYAECSCGARLTPDEVVPHMKAHALNGESHSYRAY